MKKISTLLLLILITNQVLAQKLDTLSTNKDAFVKGLVGLIDDTKKSELKDLTKEFETNVKKAVYEDYFYTDLITISNKIILNRGKAYPQLSSTLEYFMAMENLKLDKQKWDEWINTTNAVLDNSKNGDTKTILEFLEFTKFLYETKALFNSSTKSWHFTAESFSLAHNTKGAIVTLGKTQILGVTKGDTITINNTSGIYHYNENKWQGTAGTVNWQRAGLNAQDVFCTFGVYEVDMTSTAYEVDSVVFSYADYFETQIKGSLADKLIINNSPEKTSYPKFSAKRDDVPSQKITANVIYDGSFTLAGSKILGTGESKEKSSLRIYKPGTDLLVCQAFFNTITINKPENVFASNAEVSIYFGKDSIYHPSINLQLKLQENFLKLVKGEGSVSATSFFDSYHAVSFQADIIEWDLNKSFIDINTVSTSGLKAAVYESEAFFNVNKIREIRGNVSYDPLSILNIHQVKNSFNEILDVDFAKMLSPNLSVTQIQSLLFNLISEGFITWNEQTGIITIKDKVKHYVLSNAKKKDYDNIQLVSNTKLPNGRFDLESLNLNLEGVSKVPISKVSFTEFYPDSSKIVLKENRNMDFNGFFFCGNLDFFGKNNEFIYDKFTMNIPEIDTMIINIPDGDRIDKFGKPKLRPLNTVLENVSGTIEINDPRNKSGNAEMPEYPKIKTNSTSKVFFDAPQIRGGTYQRKDFFYEVNPFELDSLLDIKPRTLSFSGELHSANIFPNIKEPIKVQSDFSLGFILEAPPSGFDIYKNKAKFMDAISLNGKGLSGNGEIQFKTTRFISNDISFFPDSLAAFTDTLTVAKSKGVYEAPKVLSAKNDVKFYPYKDSLWTNSSAESPFRMYDEVMSLDGTLSITAKGVTGTGTADWGDATLRSNQFKFKADEMFADTAALQIKSLDGDKVTFNTPNVNAAVDFINYTGNFKSNLKDSKTEFGYNQYETTIDEFFWDINAKRLEFNAGTGSEGAPFTSLHKDQDSLSFLVKTADFNLETSIIAAHGVSEILIADSRIIPFEGEVVVNPEAKMGTLKNAVIEANAESKKHRIENVTIDILGKNKIRGTGSYVYKTIDTKLQYIDFPSISITTADSTLVTKKRKTQETYFALTGKGVVSEAENFIIYPDVSFYGDLEMFSSYDKLKIKGFTKIDFKSEFVNSNFYKIDSEVDPENLKMDISNAKDPGGIPVKTSIMISKSGLQPLYTEILNNQAGPLDIPMIEVNEIIAHNYDKKSYLFGLEEKIENPGKIMAGNILEFTPSTGQIHAEGALNLGTQYGVIQEKVAGTVDGDLKENQYRFNTSISFPWQFDKDLIEKLAFYLVEDNFDLEDADYTKKSTQLQLAEFFKEKDLEKAISEIELTAKFTKPKPFKENLLITDLDLIYDNEDRSYKSKGQFNLTFVGERAVHKRVSGYIQLGHRMGSDYFNIYLKTSLGDWIFINFDGGVTDVQMVSSYEDINRILQSLDLKKRTIKGESKDQFIIYGIGPEQRAIDFAKRMKQFNAEQ